MTQSVLQLPNQLVGPPQPLFGLSHGLAFGLHDDEPEPNLKPQQKQESKPSDLRYREDRDESNTVLDYMFNILWRTTKDFGKMINIIIPDTIIFKGEVPIAWYFTANSRIRAKSRAKLVPQEILSSFLKHVSPSGIVATLMIPKFVEEEFFTRKTKIKQGVLQKFVHPNGEKNCKLQLNKVVISARWSPPCCHLEKIESLQKINDKRYDIYQRVPTVDGNTMNTSCRGIRGVILSQLIGKVGFNIAQHVKSIAEDKIQVEKLNLYFKIDTKGLINFLFCSDIQYQNPELVLSEQQIKKLIFDRAYSEPQAVSAGHCFDETMLVVNRPRQLQKSHFCISCKQKINKTKIYEIKLENIADHHNSNRLINENRSMQHLGARKRGRGDGQHSSHPQNFGGTQGAKSRNQSQDQAVEEEIDQDGSRQRKLQVGNNIPPEIQTLFPNIDKDMYSKLLTNSTFLDKVVTVCEDCYLYLVSLRESSGSENYKKFLLLRDDIKLKGTGRLRPDALGIRYRDTRERIEEDVVGKFFRDRLLGEVAKGDSKAKRIFEAKEVLRQKGRSGFFRSGDLQSLFVPKTDEPVAGLFTRTFSTFKPKQLRLPEYFKDQELSYPKIVPNPQSTTQNKFHLPSHSLKLEEKTALGSKTSESGVRSPKTKQGRPLDKLFLKSSHGRFISEELFSEQTLQSVVRYQADPSTKRRFKSKLELSNNFEHLSQAVSASKLVGFQDLRTAKEHSGLELHEKESSVETRVVDFAQSASVAALSNEEPTRTATKENNVKKRSKKRDFSITSLNSRFNMYTGGG